MKKLLLPLLLTLLMAGCSGTFSDFEDDMVEGRVTGSSLIVANTGPVPVYYFVIEREALAMVYWTAQSSEDNKIGARKTRSIPLDEIYGYEKGKELVFFYWTGQNPGAEELTSIVIQTK